MEDPRCCGTGTCIINEEGFCWCGQRWDGTRMCFPEPAQAERHDKAPDSERQPALPASNGD